MNPSVINLRRAIGPKMVAPKRVVGCYSDPFIHDMMTNAPKLYTKQTGRSDEAVDTHCNSYKGFTVGTVIYQENMFKHNDYTPVVLVGFTKLLGKGNQFCKEPFRRFVVAYRYKGEIEVVSQPPSGMHLTPEIKVVPKCKYCGRAPQDKNNHGACHKPRCILMAMRDSM